MTIIGHFRHTNGRGAASIISHADGHMADYQFSEDELMWMEEHWQLRQRLG
jgi:hypothetical protein